MVLKSTLKMNIKRFHITSDARVELKNINLPKLLSIIFLIKYFVNKILEKELISNVRLISLKLKSVINLSTEIVAKFINVTFLSIFELSSINFFIFFSLEISNCLIKVFF